MRNYTPITDQARKVWTDDNGWLRIDGVELTRETVNKYLGKELDPDGEQGLEPEKVYNVYRSPEALDGAIDEFTTIDVSNEHEMDEPDKHIVSKGSVSSAEIKLDNGQKVVQGDVVIKDKPNIEAIAKKVLNAFSVGYKSVLDFVAGTTPWGESYDVKIVKIIPNHLKLTNNPRVKTATITDEDFNKKGNEMNIKDFDESKINRDGDGKFSSGGGGGSKGLSGKSEDKGREKKLEKDIKAANKNEWKSYSNSEKDYVVSRNKEHAAARSEAGAKKSRYEEDTFEYPQESIDKIVKNAMSNYGKMSAVELSSALEKYKPDVLTRPRLLSSLKRQGGFSGKLGIDDDDSSKFDILRKKDNNKNIHNIKDTDMKLSKIMAILKKKSSLKDEEIQELEKEMTDADYASRFRAALQESGVEDEMVEKLMAAINPIIEDIKAEDEEVEKATAAEGTEEGSEKPVTDIDVEVDPNAPVVEPKKEIEDAEGALDIETIRKEARAAAEQYFKELSAAKEEVKDCFGNIKVADDATPKDWYKAGCKMLGLKVESIKDEDLKVAFQTAKQVRESKPAKNSMKDEKSVNTGVKSTVDALDKIKVK